MLPAFLRRPRSALTFTWAEARAMAYLRAWHGPASRLAAKDGSLVIMDHGPVFRLAFLREFGSAATRNSASRDWWERSCAQWTATLTVLIWLDAPDAVLIERVRERDRPHAIKNKSEAGARAFLARYRQALEDVIRRFETVAGPVVLRFDTERESLDAIVNHVLEALEERVRAV
jgi:thymidylate kinase